jgi:fumarate reductase subunit D
VSINGANRLGSNSLPECLVFGARAHPLTFVVVLGAVALMLVHSAHRFRYTLYDGLQIKHKRTVAALCYGAAVVGSIVTLVVLLTAARAS